MPSPPNVTPPAVVPEPSQFLFTERQWEVAGERLVRKIAAREAQQAEGKKTQAMTDEQNNLLAWAKTSLDSNQLPAEPVQLSRHHTITDPRKFITWAVTHIQLRPFVRRRDRTDPSKPTPMMYPPDTDEVLRIVELIREILTCKVN